MSLGPPLRVTSLRPRGGWPASPRGARRSLAGTVSRRFALRAAVGTGRPVLGRAAPIGGRPGGWWGRAQRPGRRGRPGGPAGVKREAAAPGAPPPPAAPGARQPGRPGAGWRRGLVERARERMWQVPASAAARGGRAHLSLPVSRRRPLRLPVRPPAAARTRAQPPAAAAACAENMTSAFKLDFLPDMMVEGRLLVADRMWVAEGRVAERRVAERGVVSSEAAAASLGVCSSEDAAGTAQGRAGRAGWAGSLAGACRRGAGGRGPARGRAAAARSPSRSPSPSWARRPALGPAGGGAGSGEGRARAALHALVISNAGWPGGTSLAFALIPEMGGRKTAERKGIIPTPLN